MPTSTSGSVQLGGGRTMTSETDGGPDTEPALPGGDPDYQAQPEPQVRVTVGEWVMSLVRA